MRRTCLPTLLTSRWVETLAGLCGAGPHLVVAWRPSRLGAVTGAIGGRGEGWLGLGVARLAAATGAIGVGVGVGVTGVRGSVRVRFREA